MRHRAYVDFSAATQHIVPTHSTGTSPSLQEVGHCGKQGASITSAVGFGGRHAEAGRLQWNDMEEVSDTARVRIGRAQAVDIDGLLDLEQTCFTDYYEPHRFRRAEFADYVHTERKIIYVARLDSRLAAYVAGTVKRAAAKPAVSIDSLAVMPRLRSRGIGERLLKTFVRAVRRRGGERILITVAKPNENGIRFFSHRGFQRVRRLPDYYDEGVDGILMRLDT